MGICYSKKDFIKTKKYSEEFIEDDIISGDQFNIDNNKITGLDIAMWENTVPGTARRSSSFIVKVL